MSWDRNELHHFLDRFGGREYVLGEATMYLCRPEELSGAQIGFSRARDGVSLVGSDYGDWKEEWLVFGWDQDMGDPLFADSSSGQVMTAMLGTGAWLPEFFSPNLDELARRLAA